MYELLFLDVDGTLKQEPHPISEVNKETIDRACRAGKKISIASGRNRDLILRTIKELKLDEYGSSYTIALNGAHIFENRSKKTLRIVSISLELTRFLFEKAFEFGISGHIYTENYAYFNYQDSQFDWYKKEDCRSELADMNREDLGLLEPPLKFILMSRESGLLDRYKEEVLPVTSGILNAEFSSRYTLEFTSVYASKGLAMGYIASLHGYPVSSAIAVGDGENDISMLKMAGLGIAMKNALDSVKAVADTITERTCREDGVSEIIEKYLLV